MKGQGTGNSNEAITRFHYIEFFFHIFYYYWGKENILLYHLDFVILRFIISRFHCITLICLLNTGKDGRDGRDGSGLKVGFFKLQQSFLFCWKSSEILIKWPMELYVSSKMVSVVWMYQVAKKEGFFFFGHLGFSLSRERKIRYKIIFKK